MLPPPPNRLFAGIDHRPVAINLLSQKLGTRRTTYRTTPSCLPTLASSLPPLPRFREVLSEKGTGPDAGLPDCLPVVKRLV